MNVITPAGNTTTTVYGTQRPIVGDYVGLQLAPGGPTTTHVVAWVHPGVTWTIGAALPSDPPPPPPT